MDRKELERIYDAYASGLFHYLRGFTRDDGDAHDLLQDLFVKLARNPDCLAGVRNEKSFLFRMGHNLAVDWVRRRDASRRKVEALRGEKAGLFARSGDPDAGRFRRGLQEALEALPESQREAVYLKLWQGLTFEEIAEASHVSPNTAASRYRYGIDKLRELLRPVYEEIQ